MFCSSSLLSRLVRIGVELRIVAGKKSFYRKSNAVVFPGWKQFFLGFVTTLVLGSEIENMNIVNFLNTLTSKSKVEI